MGGRGSRPRKAPQEQKVRSEQAEPEEEDKEYIVGRRYKIARPLDLWSGENLDGTRHGVLLPDEDVVLLVGISGQSEGTSLTTSGADVAYKMTGLNRGLVIPQPAEGKHAGWISLEDIQLGDSTQPALSKVALPGSWELKTRYSVQPPATLRAGPSLDSSWVGEVPAGEEVLLLDFGVACGAATSSQAKLRALVVAGDKLGWISPETDNGEHLLMEVNLMGRKVVDIHQHALQHNGASLRKSYQPGRSSPWKEGATYRMLESSPIRSGPDVHSSNVGEVSAGCLVHVQEIKDVIIEWGWCPVAGVLVQDGPEKGLNGWVRCTAKDGHDVMDTRDHSDYKKALQRMKESADAFADLAMDARPHDIQAVNGKLEAEHRISPQSPSFKEDDKVEKISTGTPQVQLNQEALEKSEVPGQSPNASCRNERLVAEFSELSDTLRKLEELEQRELRWMVLGNASKAPPQLPVLRIEVEGDRPDRLESKMEPSQQSQYEWPWCSCAVNKSGKQLDAFHSRSPICQND
mmetsp:Transcript_39155/g.64618  ORF Transcript_39155/g.64618 Transcript_39155/m.64618 type:complete len:519 (+) Transcript_39155:25-1581(+)